MVTPRRMPEYNRATDGNVFEWILKAAEQVRNQPKTQKLKRDPVTGNITPSGGA